MERQALLLLGQDYVLASRWKQSVICKRDSLAATSEVYIEEESYVLMIHAYTMKYKYCLIYVRVIN